MQQKGVLGFECIQGLQHPGRQGEGCGSTQMLLTELMASRWGSLFLGCACPP